MGCMDCGGKTNPQMLSGDLLAFPCMYLAGFLPVVRSVATTLQSTASQCYQTWARDGAFHRSGPRLSALRLVGLEGSEDSGDG